MLPDPSLGVDGEAAHGRMVKQKLVITQAEREEMHSARFCAGRVNLPYVGAPSSLSML